MPNFPSLRRLACAAALAGAALAGSALAQPGAAASAAAPMGFQQLIDRLAAQGYRDVREIERKGDKLYEVKARDPQGHRVELTLDARSGEVLRQERKSAFD